MHLCISVCTHAYRGLGSVSIVPPSPLKQRLSFKARVCSIVYLLVPGTLCVSSEAGITGRTPSPRDLHVDSRDPISDPQFCVAKVSSTPVKYPCSQQVSHQEDPGNAPRCDVREPHLLAALASGPRQTSCHKKRLVSSCTLT